MSRARRGGAGGTAAIALAAALVAGAAAGAEPEGSGELDVPYLPTPEPVVERMMQLADVGPGDYVIDLGSGDGRIVVEAARRGAIGLGVELDPERVEGARRKARRAGVSERVLFLRQDLFETELRHASVVTLYLFREVNEALRPRLLERLRPGARVVSHSFDMGAWRPDAVAEVSVGEPALAAAAQPASEEEPEDPSRGFLGDVEIRDRLAWPPEDDALALLRLHEIFLWIVPADASGRWRWRVEGRAFAVRVEQRFQELELAAESEGGALRVEEARLRGRRVAFVARSGEHRYAYSGRIEGDTITGSVQIRGGEGEPGRLRSWTARRVRREASRASPAAGRAGPVPRAAARP